MFANRIRIPSFEQFFLQSPIGQAAIQAELDRLAEVRQQRIDEVQAARETFERDWPKVAKDFDAAEAKYKKAHEALLAAHREREKARAARHTVQVRFEKVRDEAIRELRNELADEQLTEFLADIDSAWQELTVNVIDNHETVGPLRGARVTNRHAIERRREALARLREMANGELRLYDPSKLKARLDELWDSLPSGDEWDDPVLARNLLCREVA